MEKQKKTYRQDQMMAQKPDLDNTLGKVPPQAIELEEAVLGAILLESKAIKEVADFLRPEHFYAPAHREIFEAAVQLSIESRPVDMLSVVDRLRKSGKIEQVGGAYRVAELTAKVAQSSNIQEHARIILEMALKRELITVANQVHYESYMDTVDVFDLLERTQRLINRLAPVNTRNVKSSIQILKETIDGMQKRKHNHGVTGLPYGYSEVDKVIAGAQNSELTIIAARPGMGKTAYIVKALLNMVIDYDIAAAFFSLEMSTEQLGQRIVSIVSEIEMEKIRRSSLGELEWNMLMNKTAKFANSKLYVDDSAALSIMDLKARCKRMKDDYGIQIVVVDYLQLMKGDQRGNREQEVSSISRGLKEISKDLNVPVIALSQLSRSVETRGGDKRPLLSDLRESGSIEQDADVIKFLYRPAYYNIEVDSEGNDLRDVLEVIVAKNRQGPLCNIPLKWIGKFTSVVDREGAQQPWQHRDYQARAPYKDGGDDEPF